MARIYHTQSNTKRITSEVGKNITYKICNLPTQEVRQVVLTGFSTLATLEYTTTSDCLTAFIPKNLTETHGIFQIEAITPDRVLSLTQLQLQALGPSGKMDSYAGPKSILPTDTPGTMVTAFPRDVYGNATRAYDELDFHILQNQETSTRKHTPKNYFANLMLDAGNNSKILVAGQADQSSTIQHHVKVLSECPRDLTITTTDLYPVADGKHFFKVATHLLYDRRDKLIENGTEVQIILSGHQGTSKGIYTSMVVNGKAESWIQNPIEGGAYRLYASICGKRSNTLPLSFESNIDSISHYWSDDILTLGPLTGPLGQLLDNGTIVHVQFTVGSQYQDMSRQLRDGYATFDIRTLWTNEDVTTASVEIHGKTFYIQKEAL